VTVLQRPLKFEPLRSRSTFVRPRPLASIELAVILAVSSPRKSKDS
jgi:hypothetical protein